MLMQPKIQSTKTNLNELRDRDLFAELSTLLKDNRLFLDKDLNVMQLAERLNVASYKIPRIVKKYLGLSVPDFINGLRIAYLHERIVTDAEWRRMTIDEMAFCAGFGSRNAFYTAYRKIYQATPTGVINALLEKQLVQSA